MLGKEVMFFLARKMETGTEGLSPCSTLVFTRIYPYVGPFFFPPLETIVLQKQLFYSVHMLIIYATNGH